MAEICNHFLEANKEDFVYHDSEGAIVGYWCDMCADKNGYCPACGMSIENCDCLEDDAGDSTYCDTCNGTGQDWDLTPCPVCNGEGIKYWL